MRHVYEHCTMVTAFLDANKANIDRNIIVVTITHASIQVEYIDYTTDKYVIYSGQGQDGHYALQCDCMKGRATLHLQKQGKDQVLVGDWVENGEEGFWSITLNK